MLASYMIIVSAKACQLPELISMVKSTLTEETVDPYLLLDKDIRLQAICTNPNDKNCYGSQADDASAVKSLSAIESKDQQLKDTLSSHFVFALGKSSEEELLNIKAQLSQWFVPDEEYSLGASLFMGTQNPCPPEIQAFDEDIMPNAESVDEDASDQHGNQSDCKASLFENSHDILRVNQLMESVVETARQAENMQDSSDPLTYDQMKNQCEALVMGKHQKLCVLQSFKEQQEAMAHKSSGEIEQHTPIISSNNLELAEVEEKSSAIDQAQVHERVYSRLNEYGQQESFRLPALSPYDKFLKATRS